MKLKSSSILLMMIAASSAYAPAQSPKAPSMADEKKKLASAKAGYTKAKVAFDKKPKDAKLKKSYIDAAMKYGNVALTSSALTPKEKYPLSLKMYREVLRLDPKNKEAKSNKELIEGIYKQMGRPVPK
jgi:hypothetical protein